MEIGPEQKIERAVIKKCNSVPPEVCMAINIAGTTFLSVQLFEKLRCAKLKMNPIHTLFSL